MEQTTFLDLMANHHAVFARGAGSPFGPLPGWISGAFISETCADPDQGFARAQLTRLLAAATLGAGVSGRVIVELELSWGSGSYAPRHRESWHMPFGPLRDGRSITITQADALFWRTAEILAKSKQSSFERATEDYRTLSLETAADSRATVPALQLVQMWMAIERLLPFRHETTMQLAFSLPALDAAPVRADRFKDLKRLYRLRSDIAHGYAFERTGEIHQDIRTLVDLYRGLFQLALSFPSTKALQTAMLAHVLTGEPEPMTGGAPQVGEELEQLA
jgi:hypothetical protein